MEAILLSMISHNIDVNLVYSNPDHLITWILANSSGDYVQHSAVSTWMGVLGRSWVVRALLMAMITSCPPTTFPNTGC